MSPVFPALQVVLERELQGHLGDFGQSSVDEILHWPCGFGFGLELIQAELRQTYMQPDSEGVVGFLQFWKGMEDGGVA